MGPLILHLYYGLFGSLLGHHCINLGVCILHFRKAVKYLEGCFQNYLELSEDGLGYPRKLVYKQGDF